MTTPTPDPPVTFGVKVIADQGHVHFDVFAGRTPAARGRAGRLVLRSDEFEEFKRRLAPEVVRYPLEEAPPWSPSPVCECGHHNTRHLGEGVPGRPFLHCLDCECNGSTVGYSS